MLKMLEKENIEIQHFNTFHLKKKSQISPTFTHKSCAKVGDLVPISSVNSKMSTNISAQKENEIQASTHF